MLRRIAVRASHHGPVLVLASLSLTGCYVSHPPPPARIDGAFVPLDAGAGTHDAAPACALLYPDSGVPLDAVVPSAPCLQSLIDAADAGTVSYVHVPSVAGRRSYLASVVSGGAAAIALVGGGPAVDCVAAIDEQLRVVWATRLVPSVREPLLVRSSDGIAIFDVGDEEARWARVSATGEVSAWRSLGCIGHEEWTVVAASPEGGFVILQNGGWTITARGYDGEGVPVGDAVTVSENGRYPRPAADDERILIGYHELVDREVAGPLALALDAEGRPQGDPVVPDGARPAGDGLRIVRTSAGLVGVWSTLDGVRLGHLDESLLATQAPFTILGPDESSDVSSVIAWGTTMLVGHCGPFVLETGITGPCGVLAVTETDQMQALASWDEVAPPLLALVGDVPIAFRSGDSGMRGVRLDQP